MNFIGCATVPTKNALPIYSINGITYFDLADLCRKKGVNWENDTFGRRMTLAKNGHKISLMPGESLVIVDGSARHLKYPVELYKGAVAVPSKFKSDIFDILFRDAFFPSEKKFSSSSIKKVIIDPGHGGYDPGAVGRKTGLREKDVNLDIANRLMRLLKSEGIDVVMTRSSDKFVSLDRRVAIANKSGADIFVSLHANANRVNRLNGFEVYYVSPTVSDVKRALSIAKDSNMDLNGICLANLSLNVRTILWDLTYGSSRAKAIELSHAICGAARDELDTKIIGIKPASFCVLRGVHIPAVLVEVGFLSNGKEERLLKNNYYRQQLAEKIAGGINTYGEEGALSEADI